MKSKKFFYCQRCGQGNELKALFCQMCGRNLEPVRMRYYSRSWICSTCGIENFDNYGWKYCQKCGTKRKLAILYEQMLDETGKLEEAKKFRLEADTRDRLMEEIAEERKAEKRRLEEETPKVEAISGIGVERAEKLKQKGIADVEEFYKTPTEKLGKILGLSESDVQEMKKEARSLLKKAYNRQSK
jgi:hypothetical protein